MHPQTRYGKKTYTTLGKILVQTHPEVANELLPFCQVTGETDLEKIPGYFKRFCEHMQIDPLEYVGKLFQQDKLKMRRLFVGAMLTIYNRHAFHQPHTNPIIRSGFVKKLSDCQSVGISAISQLIRQVIFDENTYEEFKGKIIEVVTFLNKTHGKA